jgi:protein-export membrane protein SecD
MLHIEPWKIYLVAAISFFGVLYAVPNILPEDQQLWLEQNVPGWLPSSTVNLGLDLRGGSHLLLEADTKAVLHEKLDGMAEAVRSEARKANIQYDAVMVQNNGLQFSLLRPTEDEDKARKILSELNRDADISIDNRGILTFKLTDRALSEMRTQVINQSIEIVRRRVDESGTKEPAIQRQGDSRIVVQLPGIDDPQRVKDLLGKTAKMTFHLLDEDALTSGAVGPGSRRLPMHNDPAQSIVIRKRIMVSGDMLVDAQPAFDQAGPVVSFRFDSVGAKRFCEVTRENVGRPFAIVLDDQVISAPVIRDAICGGSGQISGNFSVKEATDLSLLLRAGALPAPLKVVEERTVGPTLGSDSIEAGKIAAIIAFCGVFCFMLVTYGLFGLFANIALVLNLIFTFAILSILQATLTLPGIAGIILTIGIAVDANVLIYERIREEIRQGRTVISAVETGYRLAIGTIIDANLTTLIVALILFSFGSGPIKGFAVAMSIGIMTSMFSSIMITRMMIASWIRRTRPSTLTV